MTMRLGYIIDLGPLYVKAINQVNLFVMEVNITIYYYLTNIYKNVLFYKN